MKLRRNEICPIHHSRFCCGRAAQTTAVRHVLTWKRIGPGVKQHVETRLIRRSPAAMRALLVKKIAEQENRCYLCHELFDDFRQIVAEHIKPKGMNGGKRDDSEENIAAAHNFPCNAEKGSRRL
jgi:PP-loop superfamily ATP-utilizing enzyme